MKQFAVLLCFLLLPRLAMAVNFYDGVKAPDGLYLLSYTSAYTADEFTDSSGKVLASNLGFRMYSEMLRLSLYRGDWCFHAFSTVAHKVHHSKDASTTGLGDSHLGLGYFLPIALADIVPMLFIKFPTGSWKEGEILNKGDGQTDIKPTIFLHKTHGPWTIDAAIKYFYRLKNPLTGKNPANRFYAEGLLGYEFWNFMKVGLSALWWQSAEARLWGTESYDAPQKNLSLGSDIYFKLKPVSLSFTWLHDTYTENSLRGNYFQMKMVYRF